MNPLPRPLFALLPLLVILGCSGVEEAPPGAQPPAECAGRILEDEAVNARDLGGHPLSGGATVACGKLFRGGALSSLGEAGCGEFARLGIRAVVDLREASDPLASPPAACVEAEILAAPMPKLLPDTPESYVALLEEKAAIRALFSAVADGARHPVYFHCVIGRDRASFAAALLLLALGAERATVLAEFALSDEAGVAVKPGCMEGLLDEIERRGGVGAVLEAAGVPAAEVQALRQAARVG